MQCPHCGNEWDVSKSPCSRCGLRVRLPGPSRASIRTSMPQNQRSLPSGDLPVKQRMPASNTGFPSSQVQTSVSPISLSHADNTPSLDQAQRARPSARHPVTVPSKSIPARPQRSPTPTQTAPMPQCLQSPLRASRLVTTPLLLSDGISATASQSPAAHLSTSQPVRHPPLPSPHMSTLASTNELRLLMPGTLLRNGRYRLREIQSRQQWLAGTCETVWSAQDAQRSGSPVTICELVIPALAPMLTQSLLRTSTIALTSVGRHPHVPTLWDAFGERGRNFFVFEPADGESLFMRMSRTGRALSEQDVIACCIQLTEVLELLAQQSPPVVHGLIRPEHIFISRDGARYTLANFSVVVAGGGTQFVAGIERSRLSPYTAPELARGAIDIRSDLYSLLATAYHCVTGSMPSAMSGSIPQAQRLNLLVSSQFDAIVAKGLRTSASQRYQHPSELRADLLLLQSSTAIALRRNSLPLSNPPDRVPHTQTFHTEPDTAAQISPGISSSTFKNPKNERESLLPHSYEPPPLEERNDLRASLLWIAAIVLCLIIVVLLSRGFM